LSHVAPCGGTQPNAAPRQSSIEKGATEWRSEGTIGDKQATSETPRRCRLPPSRTSRLPRAGFGYCSHRSHLIPWGAQARNDGVRACLDGCCVCPYYARLCTAGFLGRGGLNGCPHADAVEQAQCDIRALSLAPRESWVPTAGFYPAMPSQRLESPKGDPVMSNALRTVLPRPQVTATR
jgi:hypothetical protein